MTNPALDRMIIRFKKKETLECPLYFEARVQVELSGRQMIWLMDVLPEMRVQYGSIHTSNLSSLLTTWNF